MSQLPSQCCATGSLHTGMPSGRISKVHGLDCYIAESPSGSAPKGVVVILPDAFGWTLLNSRILADEYAKKGGFLVLLPEFMDGRGLPADVLRSLEALTAPGLVANVKKVYHLLYMLTFFLPFLFFMRDSVARPRIFNFFRTLRLAEAKDLPLGCAGFCWGGYWVMQLCADKTDAVDCGFTAHPSFLSVPKDVEAVLKPVSVAAALDDHQLPRDKMEVAKDILMAKSKKGDVEHEFVVYEGAKHGFAVRANEDDKEEARRGNEAEEQAINWFTKCFDAVR
ncbi:dienelactone hydrolase [Cryomyces antarcticus]